MFSADRHPLLHVLQATGLCVLGVHKGSKKQALAWRQREKGKRPHSPAVGRLQGKKGTSVKRKGPAKFRSPGLGALEEQDWGGAYRGREGSFA